VNEPPDNPSRAGEGNRPAGKEKLVQVAVSTAQLDGGAAGGLEPRRGTLRRPKQTIDVGLKLAATIAHRPKLG
jgi:hypothetical protein